ncbi:MAG: DNA polymerase domain-containing protein [Anaerolineaceae bacterium]|nr:DNA polymerase domain-containing protein [Anaerolineaceae bacterium]
MDEVSGWLLDLYEDGERGLTLWIITDQDQRICLHQAFPVRFFAAGPAQRLRALWRWLKARPDAPLLERDERRDLFLPDPIPVLAVQVKNPAAVHSLFVEIEQCFPDLVYYDVDLQVQVRHAAAYGSFSLAHCRMDVDGNGNVQSFQTLDTRWEIDPEPPPLRVLEINLPDSDPRHAEPTCLELRCQSWVQRYPFPTGAAPVFWLKTALERFNPDILITDFGDTWLLEDLLERVNNDPRRLPLSRDPARSIHTIRQKTYFSYGQIVYRGQQVHLFGRIHIDRKNTMMWGDYEMDGILENARVTSLPIQTAARVSPGSGISCMQMITALTTGVLVPWHKQQVEQPRPMLDLIHADMGGLVYQPTVGLHKDVGAIDFVSLYPAVMVRCNISPEKKSLSLYDPLPEDLGLVPQTLTPLLEKRVALKQRIKKLPSWDPRRKWYKARAAAQKWLLVVCFGYLGYKNARFGLIGSHEAVTAGGREALLLAKETAEDAGFDILHMYVDGLWLQRKDCTCPEDFQAVLDQITKRTGLPIALDGVYRWVVFLPSHMDKRVPVANRYFGVFQDGTTKVRGLDARRRDTPPWVAATQMALIEHLALAPDAGCLPDYLPGALAILRRELQRLRAGQVPAEELLVAQRLTRAPEKYKSPSPGARAALQLQAAGREIQAGQRIRFVHVYGCPDVWAWDRLDAFDPRTIDIRIYRKLLLRAAGDIFQPFGVSVEDLNLRMEGNAAALPLWPAALPSLRGSAMLKTQ